MKCGDTTSRETQQVTQHMTPDTTSRESSASSPISHSSLTHHSFTHDSITYHTCLILMWHDMPHWHVTWPIDKRHDLCAPHTPPTYATHHTCLTRRLHTPHMSPSHVAHLLHTSHITHASFTCHMSLSYVTWLIDTWHGSSRRHVTPWCVSWLTPASYVTWHMPHTPPTYATLLPLHMWHASFKCVLVMSLLHMWHASFKCHMSH